MSLVHYFTKCGITKTGEIFFGRGEFDIKNCSHCKSEFANDFIIFAYYGNISNSEYTVSSFVQTSWGYNNPLMSFCQMIYHIHPIHPQKNCFMPERTRCFT